MYKVLLNDDRLVSATNNLPGASNTTSGTEICPLKSVHFLSIFPSHAGVQVHWSLYWLLRYLSTICLDTRQLFVQWLRWDNRLLYTYFINNKKIWFMWSEIWMCKSWSSTFLKLKSPIQVTLLLILQGKGEFTMEYLQHAQVSQDVQMQLVNTYKASKGVE